MHIKVSSIGISSFIDDMMLGSKAPSGQNRHKYVCLQASLQHHILCSVGAKHSFDSSIMTLG